MQDENKSARISRYNTVEISNTTDRIKSGIQKLAPTQETYFICNFCQRMYRTWKPQHIFISSNVFNSQIVEILRIIAEPI